MKKTNAAQETKDRLADRLFQAAELKTSKKEAA